MHLVTFPLFNALSMTFRNCEGLKFRNNSVILLVLGVLSRTFRLFEGSGAAAFDRLDVMSTTVKI